MNSAKSRFGQLCFILFLMLGLSSAVHAQTEKEERVARVQYMMTATGMTEMISRAAEQVQQTQPSSNNNPRNMPQKFLDAVSGIRDEIYSETRMLESAAIKLAEKLTVAEIEEAIAFYESEFGQEVLALEKAAQTVEMMATIKGSVQQIAAAMEEDPDRAKLVVRMIDNMDMVDNTMAIVSNVMFSMISGMVAADQIQQELNEQQIFDIAKQQLEQMRPSIEQELLSVVYVTYKNLSLDEMGKYLEYLGSENGTNLYEKFNSTIGEVFGEESKMFGRLIMEAMGKKQI